MMFNLRQGYFPSRCTYRDLIMNIEWKEMKVVDPKVFESVLLTA